MRERPTPKYTPEQIASVVDAVQRRGMSSSDVVRAARAGEFGSPFEIPKATVLHFAFAQSARREAE